MPIMNISEYEMEPTKMISSGILKFRITPVSDKFIDEFNILRD